MNRLAAYLRGKWGQGNYLPVSQEEELIEEPSTSPYEEEPPKKLVKRLAAKYAQMEEEAPDTTRDLGTEPDLEWEKLVGKEPPLPETELPPYAETSVGYTGTNPIRPADNEREPSPYDKVVGPADTSLGGKPISADRAKRWKDYMILAYDKIKRDMTELPAFKLLYDEMSKPFEKMEPMLRVFNDLINSYVEDITKSNLSGAFLYGIKYVDALNSLRDMLPRMVRLTKRKGESDAVHSQRQRDMAGVLDDAILSIQNYIWERAKHILNIHDIGSGEIPLSDEDSAEMVKILGELPRGTWQFGPGANPAKGRILKTRDRLKGLERERMTGQKKAPRYTYTPFKSKHDKREP